MSIIYGFINLDGRPADPAILDNMGSALAGKKSDAQSALLDGSVGMGLLHQYITPESRFETLPYYDAETGLYFVCEAIIDNREELAALLGLRLTNELPDGRLILESYKKWGKDCTRYLLGDFAFVVYDSKNRRALLFRDHMGLRLLYYRYDGYRFFFSTLIKPLIHQLGDKQKPVLDERYLVHFLSVNDLRQELYPGSTIYKDISYVLPASCLTITGQSVANETYWDPMAIHPDRRIKKSDYIEEFRNIYINAVRCRLRSDGNVGVMLSGGLDSSSVACVAADILRDQKRELHTYTAVPMPGFTNWTPRSWNADESPLVKTMQDAYSNMLSHFIDSKDNNSLNTADLILDIYEQPYKFIENSYWLYDICQTASNDRCKVILGGFIGNSTVSYGYIENILFEHFMRLRWMSFIRDFDAFCRGSKASRKQMMSILVRLMFRSILNLNKDELPSGYVKNEYMEKYNVQESLHDYGSTSRPLLRDRDNRRMFFYPTLLNQAYSVHTKSCLSQGICERDPTGDKRIVEFCMRLPYECYFDRKTGQDRSLIRRALSGIVPDSILREKRRGLQAADWLERLVPQWHDFVCNISEVLKQPNRLYEYLDLGLIEDLVKRNTDLTFTFDTSNDVRNIIIIDNCNKFLNML